MQFSRREILKGMGAAGITPLLISACSSSGGDGGTMLPDLPELPEYQWDGPIGPENLFEHGVASGDPLPEGVILWTRVTAEASEPVEVWWEMALDEDFLERTAQGTFMTDASRDYTVKVDVPGLIWGRNYFYRFAVQGRWSPTGRTRLAPKGNAASKLRFGVCSCANYGFGYFHAYRRIAERADLDAIAAPRRLLVRVRQRQLSERHPGRTQLRLLEPPNETVTLEDYRLRFSLYRRDPDLQECHRQHPFVVVWDDHETANNSWTGGAQNHDPETEGPGTIASLRRARRSLNGFPFARISGRAALSQARVRCTGRHHDARHPHRRSRTAVLRRRGSFGRSRPCRATSSARSRRPGFNRSSAAAKPNGESSAIRWSMSLWQLANPDGSKTNANADHGTATPRGVNDC